MKCCSPDLHCRFRAFATFAGRGKPTFMELCAQSAPRSLLQGFYAAVRRSRPGPESHCKSDNDRPFYPPKFAQTHPANWIRGFGLGEGLGLWRQGGVKHFRVFAACVSADRGGIRDVFRDSF